MDLVAFVDEMTDMAAQAGENIKSEMTQGNMTDPEKMIKMQFDVQQYSNFINYESAIIKTVKDMVQGIISKI